MLVYKTHDVNSEIWAEYVEYASTIHLPYEAITIGLNQQMSVMQIDKVISL